MRAEGGNQRRVGPGIARCPFHDALSRLSPSKMTGEPEIGAAFIDEFQVSEVGAPFLDNSLSKPAAEATHARRVPQTIMQ